MFSHRPREVLGMLTNLHSNTALRILLLFLVFILISWPIVADIGFSVAALTLSLLISWLVVILTLKWLTR
ncbi:hypothetical protein KP803_00410 [Vibrio sp. ZSDE26]|uniref:Uncharacterized protein n=1 Tax=Vibrio amylolyticus TaxID=2847292 RepID=A0A9X1XLD2_9VIBR|nr:hypothetical protein [Vibrio amylolyticus]MCK6261729.1 hypothetical protein [Vibrio amylolyticus]